jgi:hypothetical protein
MRLIQTGYLLVFIATWSLVDNFCVAPFLASPSSWVALDDDEYVPTKREQLRKPSYSRRMPVLVVGLRSPCGVTAVCRQCQVPSGLNPSPPDGPSPLYLLMSLQC